MVYYGLLRPEQKDVAATISADVFAHWDSLPTSPAKTRPRQTADLTVQGLSLLSCTANGPGWPEHVMSKFPADSPEHGELQRMKEAFEKEFQPLGSDAPAPGETSSVGGETPRRTVPRVSGRPDFEIDGGVRPIDPERIVDLLPEACPDVGERPGFESCHAGLTCKSV